MEQVFDRALLDFYHNTAPAPLFLHNNYGSTEEMPVEIFFRDEEDFPYLEQLALSICTGKILDVGAGVGAHSLFLQNHRKEVYAIERSQAACEIMKARGIQQVIQDDFFSFAWAGEKFDTLLFMMNGIGLAQTLENIVPLLEKCKELLAPNGQILFDSSDLSYLYQDGHIRKPKGYFGEVAFQYEYKGVKGAPFGWVYVDPKSMQSLAEAAGWEMNVLYEDGEDQYLARLTLTSH